MRGEAKAKAKAEREEGGRCEGVGVRAGVINGNTEERKRQNRRTKKKKNGPPSLTFRGYRRGSYEN